MLSPIADILDELRAGRMVILVDDEDRENEGDLVLAAEKVTPEAINFMLSAARGYMCLSLTEADCDRLALHPQAAMNTSLRGTPFTVSIDGSPAHGVGTGVSALDRAKSIQLAIDPGSTPDDFVRPGHINPLRSRDGGVLVRMGQTEGSVDLCRLAGLHPSAVIIEIMREDGEMARMPDLERIAAEHKLKIFSVAQVIEHRLAEQLLVKRGTPECGEVISTEAGEFNLIAFDSVVDPQPHLALTVGGVGALDDRGGVRVREGATLVRMHRRSLLGDIFHERAGNGELTTGSVLLRSMEMIQREGAGAIVYLRPEGVGDQLSQRLTAIRRSARVESEAPDLTAPDGIGAKAAPMPLREYGIGGQILRELGLRKLRLISNHPKDLPGLEAFGLEIVEHVPVEAGGSGGAR